MKSSTSSFSLIVFLLLITFSEHYVYSQLQGKDILKENYIIGESSELFTIRTQNDTVEFRIFDADGSINEDGILEKDRVLILENDLQVLNDGSPVRILSGFFDSDRYSDVVAAWQVRDTNIVMYIPEIDPNSLKVTSDYKINLTGDEMPEYYVRNNSLPRLLSLKKGQLDDDPQEEIVLAYMTDREGTEGGPLWIAIYDMDENTGMPVLKDSAYTIMLKPDMYNAANGISRGSLYDICTGDFNEDGLDEIVLVAVTEYPDDDDFGWRLDAYMYRMMDGEIEYMFKTSEPFHSDKSNSNDYIRRLAVVAGNFDNDFVEDVAVSYQIVETGVGSSQIFLRAVRGSSTGFGLMGEEERIDGSNGNNGWPLTMYAADADRNGFEEVQLAARNTLKSYSFDENMNSLSQLSPVNAYGLYNDKNNYHVGTFAATDMDLAQNDSLRTEIAVVDDRGLVIYQKLSTESYFDEIIEIDLIANGIVSGDFDGDALRLGPPRRQTISDIVRPLMVLSTPPVHFDIIDGEIYDLQDCYPIYESSDNCNTSSVYYKEIQEQQIESSVEISSTWTKTDLPIDSDVPGIYSADYAEIADRLINQEFNKIYGGGEVERKRSSRTFTFTSRTETIEDDNLQVLISTYDLLEYPVYTDDSLMRYVMVIEPSLDPQKTRMQWIPYRSSAARNFYASHEVGNILSYPKTTSLPPGARPFGSGGYEGDVVTWTVSPSSVGNWNMKFSSETITERESTMTETISNDISGSVGASFVAEASVNFEYLDNKNYEEIQSIKTTIKESSEINISIGRINTSLIGTKTYDVTPFIYWDASGALIIDYAVSPDFSGGVPSFWEEKYGTNPDFTFNLPWRYAGSRGLGGSDDDLQSKQTYDIILSKKNVKAGDTTNIYARIQNYSNVDHYGDISVRFYLGDPDNGGLLIENLDGQSEVVLDQINAREPVVATLNNWIVPAYVDEQSAIFAVVDPDNMIGEVHDNNNKAWNLIRQGSGIVGIEDKEKLSPGSGNEMLVNVYPNPAKDIASFNFQIQEPSPVKIEIYDLQGKHVSTLQHERLSAGTHSLEFAIGGLDKGVYLYRFVTDSFHSSGKLVIIR